MEPDEDLPASCSLCGVEEARFGPPADSCDGSGLAPCSCAVDRCLCHWHGERPCRGCVACMGEDAPAGAPPLPPERTRFR